MTSLDDKIQILSSIWQTHGNEHFGVRIYSSESRWKFEHLHTAAYYSWCISNGESAIAIGKLYGQKSREEEIEKMREGIKWNLDSISQRHTAVTKVIVDSRKPIEIEVPLWVFDWD